MSNQFLNPWTSEQDKILDDNYGKIPYKDIAKILNRSLGGVIQRAFTLGISKDKIKQHSAMVFATRKYSRDDNAFSVINKESSYWAGFIAADGHIQQVRTKEDKIVVFLSKEDESHLIKLKNFLKYTGPIRYSQNAAILSISSNKICDDLLKNFNIAKGNKTFILNPPITFNTEDLKLAFLKGAIDGDGGVYAYPEYKHGPQIYIGNAAKPFIQWCADLMHKYAECNGVYPKSRMISRIPKATNYCNKPEMLHTIRITGKFGLILYKNIMKINCPSLNRKWLSKEVLRYV